MHNENWDDLRFILAVSETGSVLQAAKRLGVNHATVLRRVAAFEERHGTTLFERTAQGYRLLPDSAHIIRAAQAAEIAMHEVHRLASGGHTNLQGTVRITSTDTLCGAILPRFILQMQAEQKNLSITLLSSNTYLDLSRDQANIALRPSLKLAENMVGDIAAQLGFAAYAVDDAQQQWLGLSGPLVRSVAATWMAENIAPEHITTAADSFLTLQTMAALGHGIAILPCFIGDRDTRLVRCHAAMPHLTVPLWIARHIDTIETQQLRAVQVGLLRFLGEQTDLRG